MVLTSERLGERLVRMKIYVGNLPFSVNDDSLSKIYTEYGEVVSAKVISDGDTGRSRGFGFVEMTDEGDARKAIEATNGLEVDGRTLTVNEARPQKKPGGFGGGRGGGGGGGGGRNRDW